MTTRAKMQISENESQYLNEVHLIGWVSGVPTLKLLPSGDQVVEFRVVVRRDKPKSDRTEVDALDIAVWSTKLRKRALSLREQEWVQVDGQLRRRFWRSPTGIASRWQVEASEVRRL
jgi:single-strand DNA-binding protein